MVHLSSSVYLKAYQKRKKSTPVFSLYAYCSVNHNHTCPVSYKIVLKEYPGADGPQGYVQLVVTRTGDHVHNKSDEQVRWKDRKKLANQINNEKRLAGKADNDSVPSLNTYQLQKRDGLRDASK